MAIVIDCPSCTRKLQVPDEMLGKRVKCPQCGTTFMAAANGEPEPEEPAPRRSSSVRERPSPEERRPAVPDEDEDRPRRRPRDEPDEDEDYTRPARRHRRGSRSAVQNQVSGPATALMVAMIIGCVLALCGLIMNVAGVGLGAAGAQQGGKVAQQQAFANLFSGTIGIVQSSLGLVVGLVVIVGTQKMRNLKSFGWAMTSSILAMIPCVSPCCILGLPFGIWALVVLSRPEVKAAFDS